MTELDPGPRRDRPAWPRRLWVTLGSGPVPEGAGRGGGEGVRTRDHLANTRTFLSWMRLALTLVTLGYAVDKFGLITERIRGVHAVQETGDRISGVLLVVAGGVVANLAFTRFLLQRRVIEAPTLRSRALLDVTLLAVAGVLGALVVVLLLRIGG